MWNCGMPMYPPMPGMMPNAYNNESSLREELNKLEARVSRLESYIQTPHNESNNFYMV